MLAQLQPTACSRRPTWRVWDLTYRLVGVTALAMPSPPRRKTATSLVEAKSRGKRPSARPSARRKMTVYEMPRAPAFSDAALTARPPPRLAFEEGGGGSIWLVTALAPRARLGPAAGSVGRA